jgi:hypothetical protein
MPTIGQPSCSGPRLRSSQGSSDSRDGGGSGVEGPEDPVIFPLNFEPQECQSPLSYNS